MDDTISRRDAINAVHKTGITEYDETLAIEEIERAPSAQPKPCEDAVSRKAVANMLDEIEIPRNASWYPYYHQALDRLSKLPSVTPKEQPEIIRCKDCKYGEQDEIGRWYCRSLGCQMGDDDGSGFCSDAERREE